MTWRIGVALHAGRYELFAANADDDQYVVLESSTNKQAIERVLANVTIEQH